MIIHVGFLQCWPMMCRKKHTKTQMGRFIDTVEPLYTRVDVRLLDLMSVLKVSNMCLFDNVQERCKSILGQMHKESWYC